MPLARMAAEHLLLFLFRIAGFALLAFALATVGALVAVLPLRGPDAPPWLEIVTRAWLLIAGTSLATAVLLVAARRPGSPAEGEGHPGRTAAALLGLSLVVLPALSHARVGDLVALWREILVLLDRIGFWNAFAAEGAGSGLVLLPVLVALLVPALEAAAAFFLIAIPPALLALLATRSPLLPRIYAMMATCQAGLVLASLIGADAFSRLAAELIAAMTADGDAAVLGAAEMLRRAEGVLASTARGFVAPTLGTLVWVPVLLLRRRAVPFTGAGAEVEAAGVAAWSPAPIAPRPARPAPIAPAERAAHLPRGRSAGVPIAPDPRVRIALVALGSLMLVFAAAEQLRSRARYDHSDPAPGATLASPPMAVRVGFGRALDPSSHLRVDRTAPGEEATRVGVSSGLDPDDPERRTLRADLSAASAGVYRVTWRSVPAAGGGVARHGSFGFEVGRPGTEPVSGGVQERDVGERGRRSTVVGGGLLILLGALLPGLPRLR